jgi:hypothetical protein
LATLGLVQWQNIPVSTALPSHGTPSIKFIITLKADCSGERITALMQFTYE